MWETWPIGSLAGGGEVHLRHRVVGLDRDGTRIRRARGTRSCDEGETRWIDCDAFISTMPIQQLVEQLAPADADLRRIAQALPYRDFMTAGLVVRRMSGGAQPLGDADGCPADNWIYIQEPDVKLGRLQIFNNWSPDLVARAGTVSLGLEYFCREGDDLWTMPDSRFLDFAAAELEKIGLIDRTDVLDGTVVRVPKAYPAYFGVYREIGKVRAYLDGMREPLCRGTQRHAPLQQPGPLDARGQSGR